ncbi:DNA-binding protein [Bifidobacterium bifidum]
MYQAKLEECYSLALPKQLRDAVQQTAILLSEGKSVTISATEQELTTEQAARTLGVS